MRLFSITVGLLASLLLAGCGGGHKEAAKAPETNPWADYKGTYGAGGSETKSASASVEKAPPADAKPATADAKAGAKPDEEAATAAPTTRKPAGKKRGGAKAGGKKAGTKS